MRSTSKYGATNRDTYEARTRKEVEGRAFNYSECIGRHSCGSIDQQEIDNFDLPAIGIDIEPVMKVAVLA